MEDPWNVFNPPSKDPPKLLPVSSNLKGKVRVWGHPKPPKMGFFGLKMVKKRFLTKKYKNN